MGPKIIYIPCVNTRYFGSAYYISPPVRGAETSTLLLLQEVSHTEFKHFVPQNELAPIGAHQWAKP